MADDKGTLKKDWTLTQEAFDRLLTWLDADRDRAGGTYESFRGKLITMFTHRECVHPEAAADETLDRVARRIQEGEEIRSTDRYAYVHGVAINVLREYFRTQVKHPKASTTSAIESHQNIAAVNQGPEKAQLRLKCLNGCLRQLPPEGTVLIREFYKGEKSVLIRNRHRLALQIGIEDNALRIRAHRIRVLLEKCVHGCLEKLIDGCQD